MKLNHLHMLHSWNNRYLIDLRNQVDSIIFFKIQNRTIFGIAANVRQAILNQC